MSDTEHPPTGDATDDLATDDLFGVLENRRRRMVLRCLYRYANPVSLPHIADCVTASEYGVHHDEFPERRLRVYMSLYHEHVPAMADAGIVVYSQEDDMVHVTVPRDRLKSHVETVFDQGLGPLGSE